MSIKKKCFHGHDSLSEFRGKISRKPHVSYKRNLESFQGTGMYLISCIKTMAISSELLENTK